MGLHINFTIHDARKLLFGLILFEICLVLIFSVHVLLGSPSRTIHKLFDLHGELNIPAWFSSVQLSMIGILFLLMSRRHESFHRPSRLFLSIVGAGFIFLSADEMVAIHENLSKALREVEWIPRFARNHGIWIPIYLTFGLIVLIAMYRDLWALWSRFRRESLILLGGISVFLLGGVGLEIISYEFFSGGPKSMLYQGEVALEEFLEMSGGSIILYGAILLALIEQPHVDHDANARDSV